MTVKPTLLILAAGMATRYGSLKQVDRFGPSGETIIDYSVYDAIRAGFGKVVFVIRKSMEEEFRDIILTKFANKINIDTVYQELDNLPKGFSVPHNRTKPWGTGHAVWVSASKINEPFAVINADDFYGYQSFKAIADFLRFNKSDLRYSLVGYYLKNTLSRHGSVSRGICKINEQNYLECLLEQPRIVKKGTDIIAFTLENEEMLLTGKEIVSMNMMSFHPSVFPYFETCFKEFLHGNIQNPKAEFYLPDVVNSLARSGRACIKVLLSVEEWFGVTYPNDKPLAVRKIKELTESGLYPENLWEKNVNQR